MPADKTCSKCQAMVSPFATVCPSCRNPMGGASSWPLPRTARVEQASPPQVAYGSSVAMTAAERRPLAVTQMCVQTTILGSILALASIRALQNGGPNSGFLMDAVVAAFFFFVAWTGWKCQPLGKTLLLVHSAFCILAVPIGTIQGIFQIIHLSRPEALLVFTDREGFSPDESRDIGVFKEANPNLTVWLRITNLLGALILALLLFVSLFGGR